MDPFDPFPTLRTERLLLRRLVPGDVAGVLRLNGDPQVIRYLGRAPDLTLEDAGKRLGRMLTALEERTGLSWALVPRAGGELMGVAVLFRIDATHRLAEIGYSLLPAHWGQGLTSEALRPIVRHGFTALDLHRIEAHVDPENVASLRVLARLGFQREALLRENWHHEGRFTDTVVCGLLRREAGDLAAPAEAPR